MLAKSLVHLIEVSKRPVRGVDYLRNRFTNKGTAFTAAERSHMNVEGLLPPSVETLDDQVERYWDQLNRFNEPINRYQLLRNVQNTNVTLYYAILTRYLKQTLPIVYTPTVGEACQRYGDLYQKDHGLYLDVAIKGKVRKLIQNLRKTNVDVIVITDGSRILGLGDLGANGIGISIGKCSLYVAAGGVKPSRVLPVVMDVGTNNLELRNNPLYLGLRKPRCGDADFYALLDEFMEAVKDTWPSAVVQFEDFSNNHCFDMLERYQKKYRCFNDDIQGTGAVIAAGFHTAVKLSKIPMEQQRIVFFGAGSAATGVAESIADLAAEAGMKKEDVKKSIFFVDSMGMVATNRGDKLAKHKLGWARTDIPDAVIASLKTLEDVVRYVRPTALIGLGATANVFSREIVEFLHSCCPHPIIFPLSNPSSKAEIVPANAYKWTNGDAIVASGSPFPETVVSGRTLQPSQGNNLYIFPGVGLGCCIAQPPYIPQEVLVAAAACLSTLATPDDLAKGQLYPSIEEVRRVSREVAVACIQKLQELGLAKADLPDNRPDLMKLVKTAFWEPRYLPENYYLEKEFIC
ncbi:putative malic enzyme [Leishmania infantum JPCM5]|uniref:Malic_enzyme_-_putative n=2 Tax=Leishmania infantum TaxID=5671 RepID=A0A6L0XQQ2_LEIIN|nr:putative malic enzyme [Leishmania infantum JPCM5]CAC9491376.1 malic_enzyme_-_putative [Leishmania infantum]CAM68338.1 putative malic enzyme [Leishmania infantum JPCM5]SUZ42159.1 malic_enzyme_-_putative [Leishmania infantum]|eukprot:XP_001465907.1 putative malic enzyme [Leishmania infantum JPCM5]